MLYLSFVSATFALDYIHAKAMPVTSHALQLVASNARLVAGGCGVVAGPRTLTAASRHRAAVRDTIGIRGHRCVTLKDTGSS
jgi:hypothetical protein